MTDSPETRHAQVTVYDGMDWFAVIAAAWQEAEATVADNERVVHVNVMPGSPPGNRFGDEHSYTIEYVVARRV